MRDIFTYIIFLIFFLAGVSIFKEIQRRNDYKRCLSVVGAAVKTGKLSTTTLIEEACKYHLK